MSSSNSNSQYTAFRCPEDLLRKAKIRAKRDRRSLSNYLITLIDRDCAGMDESVPMEADGMNDEEGATPGSPRLKGSSSGHS